MPARYRIAAIFLAFFTAAVRAAAPVLDHLHPAGGAQGSTNLVSIEGEFDPWPPKIWVAGEGLDCAFETNKGKLTIIVAADARPGSRLLRLYNGAGASEPRFFVVGERRELVETEPNDHFLKPQPVEDLPVTLNGHLEKRGDVDSFAIPMKAGEWLDARMESYVLMGRIDGVLRLVTAEGRQLEWNHDSGTLDPRLVWRAPREQTVVLQAFGFAYPANAAIQLSGGDGAIYRLHLRKGSAPPADLCEPSDEHEPNGAAATAGRITLPARIRGSIAEGHDQDRFVFEARSGKYVVAELESERLGSPLDAWLAVEDADGKELARNDDAGGSFDPKLEWQAPADGQFVLAVGSVTHRGGPDFSYRLNAARGLPGWEATLEASAFVLKAGETNTLRLKVDFLRGFTNALTAAVRNLPTGITASEIKIPEKGGEVAFSLSAAADAPAFSGPFEIVLRDETSGREQMAKAIFTTRAVNNGVPNGYTRLLIESTAQLWLTVPPIFEEKGSLHEEK